MRPSLSRRAFVPAHLLEGKVLRRVRSDLTFDLTPFDRYSSDPDDDGSDTVISELVPARGGWSLPRAYAQTLPFKFRDCTVFPAASTPRPRSTLAPRDERQSKFFSDLLNAAKQPGPQDILAIATTGAGKTAASLWLGLQLRTPMLVIVDSNNIARGWVDNCRKFFGSEWTEKYVGRVQQDTIDYTGKAVTLSLVQSLSRRNYGLDFYRYFGLIAIDEVQVMGTESFGPVMSKFSARVRLGVTAGNKKGAGGKLICAHLGEPRVQSLQKVMEPHAWVLTYEHKKAINAFNDGVLINSLVRVADRNNRLADLIVERGIKRGRKILALSDRTAQLVNMRNLLIERGVPASQIGIYAGEYESGRICVAYSYGVSGNTIRLAAFETKALAKAALKRFLAGDYSVFPNMPKAARNRITDLNFKFVPEIVKPTHSELDNITNSCQTTLATYRIFAKGIDVPALDMGVELSPYGDVKQPLGRVLRIKEGKATPEWYALHDTITLDGPFGNTGDANANAMEAFFNGRTNARYRALRAAGAKVKRQ